MTQLVWEILFVVAGAGAVGGVVNALLSDNGDIALPTLEQGISAAGRTWQPAARRVRGRYQLGTVRSAEGRSYFGLTVG